jgi:hypothetical protein
MSCPCGSDNDTEAHLNLMANYAVAVRYSLQLNLTIIPCVSCKVPLATADRAQLNTLSTRAMAALTTVGDSRKQKVLTL